MAGNWTILAARAIGTLWAAFWAFFVVADVISEPSATAYRVMSGWMAILGGIVFLLWRRPLVGGLLSISAGLTVSS